MLLVSDIAEALEDCTRISSLDGKREVLRILFEKCADDVDATEDLLRVLLPNEDRKHVYGFKTRRLMRIVANALQSDGHLLAAARLRGWQASPVASTDADKPEDSGVVVCLPEFAIASAIASCAGAPQEFTLSELLKLCSDLSAAYSEWGDNDLVGAKQTQIIKMDLLTKAPSFSVCVLIVRLLLRCVTMGVGPATVLGALPSPHAAWLFERRHDLRSAALSQNLQHGVVCGVPFVPMTCEALQSPYLFKWLFSREEQLTRPLTPIDARLLIDDGGRWYVPLTTRAPQCRRLVDLEDPRVLHEVSGPRHKHFELLRLFKRADLIDAAKAKGLLIHYTLSIEEEDVAILLIRDTSDAIDAGIELVSIADPKHAIGEELVPDRREDDDDEPADKKRQQSQKQRIATLNSLLLRNKKPLIDEEEEGESATVEVSKHSLRVVVATCRKPPRQKKRQAAPLVLAPPVAPAAPAASRRGRSATIKPTASSAKTVGIEDPSLKRRKSARESTLSPKAKRTAAQQNNADDARKRSNSRKRDDDDKKGVIIQTKYDGDRLQAHVHGGGRAIKLFTRRGLDVTDLYSNVATELKKWYTQDGACVLDGELIVVNSKSGKPLPWSNEKWRHNHRADATGETDSPLVSDLVSERAADCVVMLEYSDNVLAEVWEDGYYNPSSAGVSFVPLSNLRFVSPRCDSTSRATLRFDSTGLDYRKWGNATLHHETRAHRADKATMLQFVVFDVLMWNGQDTMKAPYAERLSILMENDNQKSKKVPTINVIPDGDMRVRSTRELAGVVREAVADGHEGCVLKDPSAGYQCRRARCVQKVKPRGPDVNAGVVGIGFSLSNNPRRWGILTCIQLSESVMVTYCRTEVLEGDSLPRAFQHVHRDIASRVCVKDVLSQQRDNLMNKREVPCKGDYTVTVTSLGANYSNKKMLKVEWHSRTRRGCTLVVMPEALEDVQWLVNPFDVDFALSLRGDLRPIERSIACAGGDAGEAVGGIGDIANNNIICIPRHPVGRLEFDPRSEDWDTPASTQRKFRDAQEVATCIETWTLRRLAGLRALPPSKQRMEEVGRILGGWMGDQDEVWPQVPPGVIYSIDALSDALEHWRAQNNNDAALRPLSSDERKAMAGLPPRSQWVNQKKNATIDIINEEETYDRAATNRSKLQERLNELRQNTKLVAPVRHAQK